MTHAERYPDNLARAISVSLQNALFLSVGSPNFFLIVFLKKKIEGGKGKHEGGEIMLDFDGRLLIYSPGSETGGLRGADLDQALGADAAPGAAARPVPRPPAGLRRGPPAGGLARLGRARVLSPKDK